MKFEIDAKVNHKVTIDFDDALNDAGWTLLDKIGEYQHVDGPLFNNLKSCLKAAIETYLEKTIEKQTFLLDKKS